MSHTQIQRIKEIAQNAAAADPAHDFTHSVRVLNNALKIAKFEGGDSDVLQIAAYLHDISNLPKNHPDSKLSSERSSLQAEKILRDHGFPEEQILKAKDAILCHSYSRGLVPQTLEGKIFQDADRLDALGAIGIARTFTVGGATQRPLYSDKDPFTQFNRIPDDKQNTLDHFFVKLFKLGNSMQTPTGVKLAEERIKRMRRFIEDLQDEIQ